MVDMLLHVDMEFTNPNPELGEVMQIGMVAHEMNFDIYRANHSGFLGDRLIEGEAIGHIKRPWYASRWVLKNQKRLMQRCSTVAGTEPSLAEFTMAFIEGARVDFDADRVIVCGWCVANDYVFLKNMLPGYDYLHHQTIELDNLAMALFGAPGGFDNDAQIEHFLGVERDGISHDALSDARFQMKAVRKALRLCQERLFSEEQ